MAQHRKEQPSILFSRSGNATANCLEAKEVISEIHLTGLSKDSKDLIRYRGKILIASSLAEDLNLLERANTLLMEVQGQFLHNLSDGVSLPD